MKALVMGLGKSGYASALALNERNDDVTVLEEFNSEEKLAKAVELRKKGIEVIFKLDRNENNFNLIVPSPGISYQHPILANTKTKVISEIELGYELNPAPNIVAVTGTNGKTTTVNMLDAIYKEAGRNHHVAGNIGNPYVDLRKEDLNNAALILELSSFQLHFIKRFKARIAILLNITEDHVDWHGNFKSYLEDKKNIFLNQCENDTAVINIDDKSAADLISGLSSKVVTVSSKSGADFNYQDGSMCFKGKPFMNIKDFKLIGRHNVINALSAAAAAYNDGIGLDVCARALSRFRGLAHRLEVAGIVNGRTYINDSKSTNPDSLVKALEGMEKEVILLAGGRNKENSFKEVPTEKIKHLICFGQSGQELAKQISADKTEVVESLKEAVRKANEISEKGDVVLLSPGCASFDEFNDYKHRGDFFKKLVKEEN